MSALSSPRAFRLMGALMAAGAVADALPAPFVTKTLDTVEFPQRYRWIFTPIKAAAAIGLLSVGRFPGLARLTSAMSTLYFALAVGSHIRVRDLSASSASAAAQLAIFAAMTAEGPSG